MSKFNELLSLRKIRGVAEYQFGVGIGSRLFPADVNITYSKRTGRIRHVYFKGELLATLRPTDGLFSLNVEGAKRLLKIAPKPKLRVVIQEEVSQFIRKGGNVFAKHVLEADQKLLPKDEAIIVDNDDNILAIGKAVLNGEEMLSFKRGVAVKVRRGVEYNHG
jgi:predicted RNA-binding protein (TIGR00451 family)